ncbi:MAG: hypothetical protein AMQ74_01993 [Candidatus Methanofastidiosum methylothiophilum]|uniref:Uncharacterized protein n=1 Tax=Candidatus Methanofastidiosum methylothiophilum TaxID=1705564 RepID=A0A150IHW8_9EURY|nr:MAG: hypothetical protein AMQ74_01993 [Candidatus Methanofastidiosum methylthiophilus]
MANGEDSEEEKHDKIVLQEMYSNEEQLIDGEIIGRYGDYYEKRRDT